MNQYSKNYLIFLIPIALFFSIGCAAQSPTGNIMDDLGRSISINKIPERIISLAPSANVLMATIKMLAKKSFVLFISSSQIPIFPECLKCFPDTSGASISGGAGAPK